MHPPPYHTNSNLLCFDSHTRVADANWYLGSKELFEPMPSSGVCIPHGVFQCHLSLDLEAFMFLMIFCVKRRYSSTWFISTTPCTEWTINSYIPDLTIQNSCMFDFFVVIDNASPGPKGPSQGWSERFTDLISSFVVWWRPSDSLSFTYPHSELSRVLRSGLLSCHFGSAGDVGDPRPTKHREFPSFLYLQRKRILNQLDSEPMYEERKSSMRMG